MITTEVAIVWQNASGKVAGAIRTALHNSVYLTSDRDQCSRETVSYHGTIFFNDLLFVLSVLLVIFLSIEVDNARPPMSLESRPRSLDTFTHAFRRLRRPLWQCRVIPEPRLVEPRSGRVKGRVRLSLLRPQRLLLTNENQEGHVACTDMLFTSTPDLGREVSMLNCECKSMRFSILSSLPEIGEHLKIRSETTDRTLRRCTIAR
jgi:hypothetical protein